MTRDSGASTSRWRRHALKLDIAPVMDSAGKISDTVTEELPGHAGLSRAAQGVTAAAAEAKRVSQRLQRPLGWHRLPAVFLCVALAGLAFWTYWQFFATSELVLAVSSRDAVELRQAVGKRVRLRVDQTLGSAESVQSLQRGTADVAFVQGGVAFPRELPHLRLPQDEVILFFLRDSVSSLTEVRTILTSEREQGSHALAKVFARLWGIDQQVTFVHQWRKLTDDAGLAIDEEVDAVFVVKDPLSPKVDGMVRRLAKANLRLASPDIGLYDLRLDYLQPYLIEAGYLDPVQKLPAEPVETYAVATFLVTRQGLSAQQLAAASHLADAQGGFPEVFEPTFASASDVAQGLEALLGIVVYIGIAFLTLLGLDVVAYRRRFNELNSLVSLISMHQSSKDVIGVPPDLQAHHVKYLSVCSDLLGLIAVITGYYAQENSSLLYNRLLQIIQERCDSLKLNIQLKILHAMVPPHAAIESTAPPATETPPGPETQAGLEMSD